MQCSACSVGDIAGPVETQFGFHIIKLEAIKAAEGPKLETVKAQIEEELRKAEAGKRFAEAAETFSNLVYEQPDSLKPAADELKLELHEQRLDHPAGRRGQSAAEQREVPARAVLRRRCSSRTATPRRSRLRPTCWWRPGSSSTSPRRSGPSRKCAPRSCSRLTHDKAVELAKQEGQAMLAQLQKGESDGRAWSPPQMVTRERRAGLHPEAAQAVFGADASKLPAYVGLATPDGRYVIYRISRIVEVETVDAEARKTLARQLEQVVGWRPRPARLTSLKQRTDVRINQKAMEKSG